MSISIDWDWDKSFTENARILNSQEHERRLNEAARVMAKDLGCNIEDQLIKERKVEEIERAVKRLQAKQSLEDLARKTAPRKTMHWRCYPISASAFSFLFEQAEFHKLIFKLNGDAPQGARIVRWYLDGYRDSIVLILEHESFAEIEEGAEIPSGPPIEFEVIDDGPQPQVRNPRRG